MLSHTRMGIPYEYTHMGRPIRVWANIRIWGRTNTLNNKAAGFYNNKAAGFYSNAAAPNRSHIQKQPVS